MAGLTEGAGVGAKEYTTSSGTSADVLEVFVSDTETQVKDEPGWKARGHEFSFDVEQVRCLISGVIESAYTFGEPCRLKFKNQRAHFNRCLAASPSHAEVSES